MAELLLEILTEEIPARMQGIAARELERLMGIALEEAGLGASKLESFVTPRRLTLVVTGLPLAQPGAAEERRGPRVGAPPAAIEGFLRSAGLATLDQCEKRGTDKGEFYFAIIHRPGRATADVLPALLGEVIRILPWPKSMRFPAANFRWVRPITAILSLFDGAVLDLGLDGLPVGEATLGHRFLAPGRITVRDFADYRSKLRAAHVILDPAERRTLIAGELAKVATKASLQVKDDPELLEEVTGLVEWPVVLLGRIDSAFMELPPEVLTTSMRTHQKYFACLDAKGGLAPHFLLVANMPAADGGKLILVGNERVLRARLSDAKFFWDQDRKVRLEARVPKLAERVFHARLGSVLDKVRRVTRLAERLGEALVPNLSGAHVAHVRRAAELMKADLSSGMVGEFPELQGIMGRYYALNDGEAPEVAEAIAEHYSPLGPNDRCPNAPISVAVALADKIDTLVQFFAIDEKPTGSKDPYALRRAALGIIRLILENRLRLSLAAVFRQAAGDQANAPTTSLLDFFADRLKVALRDKGVRHDLIAAVFALGGEDDLVRLLARVEALDGFLRSDDGANLLVAYRRASNIVRIEEKKDGTSYLGAADPARFAQNEEKILAERLAEAVVKSGEALGREEFSVAMAVLSGLRAPIDAFFAKVTVNAENRELRVNRLLLLSQIRDTLNRVADFSQIEG